MDTASPERYHLANLVPPALFKEDMFQYSLRPHELSSHSSLTVAPAFRGSKTSASGTTKVSKKKEIKWKMLSPQWVVTALQLHEKGFPTYRQKVEGEGEVR